MRVRALKIGTLLCVATAVSLLTWSWVIWASREPELTARQQRPWSPVDMEATVFELAARSPTVLRMALDRPVFSRSRRPFQPALQEAEPPAEELVPEPRPSDTSGLSLKGIVVTGPQRWALIASVQSPEGVWLRHGAEIDGWTITGLEPEAVTLMSGGKTSKLKLYVDNPAITVGSEVSEP